MTRMTFADAVNTSDPHAAVQAVLDEINAACRKHPNSPRDAGVLEPEKFVEKPLKLVSLDLEDSEFGHAVVDSYWGEKKVEFYADDNIDEWANDDLLSELY